MSTETPNRGRTLSIAAMVLGLLAVVMAAASFVTDAVWELRATALVLIVLGLGLGRMTRRPIE